jgi:hypothetical protein
VRCGADDSIEHDSNNGKRRERETDEGVTTRNGTKEIEMLVSG